MSAENIFSGDAAEAEWQRRGEAGVQAWDQLQDENPDLVAGLSSSGSTADFEARAAIHRRRNEILSQNQGES